MTQKPRIVIAEDNVLILEGSLRPLLESEFEVVATVCDGGAALEAAARHMPDVMLLDVSLPVLRGFEAARKILATHPGIRILFVSNYADPAYVDEAFRMGAGGYVLKTRVAHELVAAIKAALGGEFHRP